jgi:hypothetical protein
MIICSFTPHLVTSRPTYKCRVEVEGGAWRLRAPDRPALAPLSILTEPGPDQPVR